MTLKLLITIIKTLITLTKEECSSGLLVRYNEAVGLRSQATAYRNKRTNFYSKSLTLFIPSTYFSGLFLRKV